MNPDDAVLVALVNNERDFNLAFEEHWYRIPVKHAPRFFSGAQVLAFYLGSAFKERKWSIREYAAVKGHELARRRDLLPGEPHHPRADEVYYKLELGEMCRRDTPILSRHARRILFLWTNWERFSNARELKDLLRKGAEKNKFWRTIQERDLEADPEMLIREGHSRYRVDFMVIRPRWRLPRMIRGLEPLADRRTLLANSLHSVVDVEHKFEPAAVVNQEGARLPEEE